jgi:hypothetical protein
LIMKHLQIFLCFFIWPILSAAQTPGWDSYDQLLSLREELRKDIQANDINAAARHTDELLTLSDATHAALVWDERWLIYLYTERFERLLDEVYRHTAVVVAEEANKTQPPADQLFTMADKAVYDNYDRITEAINTEYARATERRDFLFILLNHALRSNRYEDQVAREQFLETYKDSKFADFVRNFTSLPPAKQRYSIQGDIGVLNYSWQDNLERALNPGWGISGAVGIWRRRWTTEAYIGFAASKISRNTPIDGVFWPKDSTAANLHGGLRIGFDALRSEKIRIWPAIEGGWSNLYDGGGDLDPYFNFNKPYWGATINADLRLLKMASEHERYLPMYYGVRVRVGYHRLYFGNNDPALRGDAFFITVTAFGGGS